MSHESRTSKVETLLASIEASFRSELLRLLPTGVSRGTDYFTNSEFSQCKGARANPEAESLLQSARQCLSLREALSFPTEGCLAQTYVSACEENASTSEHRRGPKRLAEFVLGQAKQHAA